MEIINLGKADGLPQVGWPAVAAKLDAGWWPPAGNRRSTRTASTYGRRSSWRAGRPRATSGDSMAGPRGQPAGRIF